MTAAIQMWDVTKSFGPDRVLDGISLEVPAGHVYALLGTNGAGKTTTISILTTLLRADSGTAAVAGHDVATDPAAVRQSISMTGQNVTVDAVLTGLENLVLIARLRHVPRPRQVAADLIERFGLASAATKPTATYSGGMKRRLDIAMSLIGEPEVIFLDEPTTGLDPQGRIEVWNSVKELAGRGTTVLLTTQHLDEAEALADRIAILHEGRIIANGTLAELRKLLPPARVEYVEKRPSLEEVFLAIVGDGVPGEGPR
jgi:ABC-2 type transport system ATP-binding protein